MGRWGIYLLLASLAAVGCHGSKVIRLTDENFDEKTAEGAWFINIFAPWCSHCKHLEPAWEQLAEELDGRVNVAKVDGTKEHTTAARFDIHGYPSLFLLRDGQTYEYAAETGVTKMANFATDGWRKASPRAWYRAPNSPMGRMIGRLLRLPQQTSKLYFKVHEDTGLPHPVLLGGVLSLLAVNGVLMLCIMDSYYTRRAAVHAPRPHQH